MLKPYFLLLISLIVSLEAMNKNCSLTPHANSSLHISIPKEDPKKPDQQTLNQKLYDIVDDALQKKPVTPRFINKYVHQGANPNEQNRLGTPLQDLASFAYVVDKSHSQILNELAYYLIRAGTLLSTKIPCTSPITHHHGKTVAQIIKEDEECPRYASRPYTEQYKALRFGIVKAQNDRIISIASHINAHADPMYCGPHNIAHLIALYADSVYEDLEKIPITGIKTYKGLKSADCTCALL